jgi:hypothetical protein
VTWNQDCYLLPLIRPRSIQDGWAYQLQLDKTSILSRNGVLLTGSLERLAITLTSHFNQQYIGLTVTGNQDCYLLPLIKPRSIQDGWAYQLQQDKTSILTRNGVLLTGSLERLAITLTSHLNQQYLGLTVTGNQDCYLLPLIKPWSIQDGWAYKVQLNKTSILSRNGVLLTSSLERLSITLTPSSSSHLNQQYIGLTVTGNQGCYILPLIKPRSIQDGWAYQLQLDKTSILSWYGALLTCSLERLAITLTSHLNQQYIGLKHKTLVEGQGSLYY